MFSLRTGGVKLFRRSVTAFADAAIAVFVASVGESDGFSG